MKKTYKDFRIVAISSNSNSFGLHGVVLVAEDGEAWEIGISLSYINNYSKGSVIKQERTQNEFGITVSKQFVGVSYEIPRELQTAPKDVVAEIFS